MTMSAAARFNQTGFSRFINSPAGRVFRLGAFVAFLTVGILLRHSPVGIALMAWSIVPLTAGSWNLCYISGLLGGPFSSKKIRELQA
jgi:hypothetical protein